MSCEQYGEEHVLRYAILLLHLGAKAGSKGREMGKINAFVGDRSRPSYLLEQTAKQCG